MQCTWGVVHKKLMNGKIVAFIFKGEPLFLPIYYYVLIILQDILVFFCFKCITGHVGRVRISIFYVTSTSLLLFLIRCFLRSICIHSYLLISTYLRKIGIGYGYMYTFNIQACLVCSTVVDVYIRENTCIFKCIIFDYVELFM